MTGHSFTTPVWQGEVALTSRARMAMTGQAGAHANRPELVAVHGYDTKYAMHALRLGFQGIELLTTGRITFQSSQPC